MPHPTDWPQPPNDCLHCKHWDASDDKRHNHLTGAKFTQAFSKCFNLHRYAVKGKVASTHASAYCSQFEASEWAWYENTAHYRR